MILALAVEGHGLGADLTVQGLGMCLALPWQELVLAVAAIVWWPRACGLPVLALLWERPGQGAGTPAQSLRDKQPLWGNGAGGGQRAAPRLCLGSRKKEAGCGKNIYNSPKT